MDGNTGEGVTPSSQLPHLYGNIQDDLLRELQEAGMYEFAHDQGLLPDLPIHAVPHVGEECRADDPHLLGNACQYGEGPVGPAPSAGYPPGGNPEVTNDIEGEGAAVNQAVDMAVERASDLLYQVNQGLHEALSSGCPNPPGCPPGSGSKGRRKTTKSLQEPAPVGRSVGKGLRHFSMKVCEKVESKLKTTYNEVADELVQELSAAADSNGFDTVQYDEKNIRRRVYDAINVLMAMDIIEKDKKEIIWKGFPNMRTTQSVEKLRQDKLALAKEVQNKQALLQGLVDQQRSLKQLLEKNSQRPTNGTAERTSLQLPFILVQAQANATVEVQISEDMKDVQFDFYNSPFQIHDDSYVLRLMEKKERECSRPVLRHNSGPGTSLGPSVVPGQRASGSRTRRMANRISGQESSGHMEVVGMNGAQPVAMTTNE